MGGLELTHPSLEPSSQARRKRRFSPKSELGTQFAARTCEPIPAALRRGNGRLESVGLTKDKKAAAF